MLTTLLNWSSCTRENVGKLVELTSMDMLGAEACRLLIEANSAVQGFMGLYFCSRRT